jgi:hypothetical protein
MAAGRGSPNPMPAGLSALLKPDAASRGKPVESMEKLFSVAKDLPDSVLADVLAGRSLQVPQYLAMLVATGRKNLRTAMQGVQARAQMQQPSVKDKLMAEEAVSPMMGQPMQGQMPVMAAEGGLASLPAPNMDTVDMADGGIIAFNGEDDEQVVKDKEGRNFFERLRDSLYSPSEVYLSDIMRGKKATPPAGPQISAANIEGMRQGKTPVLPSKEQADELQRESTRGIRAPLANLPVAAAPAAAPSVAGVGAPPVARAAAPAVAAAAPTDSGMGSLKSYMDAIKANQEDYYKKLEGFGAKEREGLAQLRRQGGGEALMNIAQGILSKPTLSQGISAGLPGVIQSAAASRKDQREVNALANSYDMNLAKARAADARGNTDAALKFMNLADEAKYRAADIQYKMASLNKDPEAVRYLRALAKPGESLSDTFARVEGVKSKTNLYSIDKATDDFNKIMENPVGSEAKKLKAAGITTPFAYQQYVLSQSGGGIDLSAAAKAELERRKKE